VAPPSNGRVAIVVGEWLGGVELLFPSPPSVLQDFLLALGAEDCGSRSREGVWLGLIDGASVVLVVGGNVAGLEVGEPALSRNWSSSLPIVTKMLDEELGTELVPSWPAEMVEGCGEKSSKGVRLGATDGAAVEGLVVGGDVDGLAVEGSGAGGKRLEDEPFFPFFVAVGAGLMPPFFEHFSFFVEWEFL
jgi:hypothetical protein